jgi:hypothetical protein
MMMIFQRFVNNPLDKEKNLAEVDYQMNKQMRIATILITLIVMGSILFLQNTALANVSIAQSSVAGDVLANGVSTIDVYLPLVGKFYVFERPLWRFGAAKAVNDIMLFDPSDLKQLRLGWYVNWGAKEWTEPYGIEYVPMVRVKQWKDDGTGNPVDCCVDCAYLEPYAYTANPTLTEIATLAAAHPGKLWLLGNEIERVDWATSGGGCAHQDEILPELYATAYHDFYSTIKAADPTAQIAIGGVIQATPLRLEYLTRIWDAYQTQYGEDMPVDVWNVHGFVLQEVAGSWGADIPAGIAETEGMLYTLVENKDFTIVQEHLIAMRQWMADRGQQNKPLIITEYGVLMPEWIDPAELTYEDVRDDFMLPSFEFFLNYTDSSVGYPADGNRLVQRWNWYSLDDDQGWYEEGVFYQGFNGNLFYSGNYDQPMGLSNLGQYWIDYVGPLPEGSEPLY